MPLLGGKGNKFKVDPPKIRIEKVAVERTGPALNRSKPKPRFGQASTGLSSRSSAAASASGTRPSPRPFSFRHNSHSPYPSSSDESRLQRKRKPSAGGAVGHAAATKPSPGADRVAFDKDSDNEDDGWMSLDTRKRQRRATSEEKPLDSKRKFRHLRAFEGRNSGLRFIHAVEVASLEAKCVPVMGAQKEDVAIELQYPSMQPREKYDPLSVPPSRIFPLLFLHLHYSFPNLCGVGRNAHYFLCAIDSSLSGAKTK